MTAIVDGKREWTYQDLDRRAASIAERLIDLRVEAEAPVGVCMRRSAEMVAAMLGVWKAGAAYVPLNPDDHPSRLARLAAEARTSVVLSDMSVVLDHPCCVDVRDLPRASEMRHCSTHAVGTLAYVLFTSGSTGKPKGVAVEHRNTAALIDWATRCYSAEELSGVLASTSISFDLSVFELFAPLCSGGTVILAENLLLLPDLPAADRVTLINTVPSAMAALVRERSVPASVRVVNMAGEPLHPSLVEDIFRTTNVGVVYNLYGPRRTRRIRPVPVSAAASGGTRRFGRPLPNRQAYILDSHLQPVPIGVTGELYLGGHGVARGYLNQPELTAEKFILSPFYPGERLYKTGDLARYRDSGDIDFLGRADDQIKLRGFRIEPGEIIAALRERSRVRDAYVMVRGAGSADASLVVYVVPAHPEQDAQAIRRDLDEALPPYMVPSAIVLLDKLPNTRHGKVDRAALPAPERPVPSAPRPRTALERDIAAAWQEVLSLPAIGLTETFFELGGHSLLLVRLQGRLRDTVGEVPLLDLFRFPTVRALAAHLSDRGTHRLAGIEAAQRRVVKQRERVRRPSPGRAQARER